MELLMVPLLTNFVIYYDKIDEYQNLYYNLIRSLCFKILT